MSKREREREKKDIRRYDWKKERDRERGGKEREKRKTFVMLHLWGASRIYIYIENYKKFYELIDFLLPIFFFFVIAL